MDGITVSVYAAAMNYPIIRRFKPKSIDHGKPTFIQTHTELYEDGSLKAVNYKVVYHQPKPLRIESK